MRYIVEYFMFDPLFDAGEYTGEDIRYEERFTNYPDALKFSCKQIQEDFCHALFLSELDRDDKLSEDTEPILSYCP